jgi:hypothetical protein
MKQYYKHYYAKNIEELSPTSVAFTFEKLGLELFVKNWTFLFQKNKYFGYSILANIFTK